MNLKLIFILIFIFWSTGCFWKTEVVRHPAADNTKPELTVPLPSEEDGDFRYELKEKTTIPYKMRAELKASDESPYAPFKDRLTQDDFCITKITHTPPFRVNPSDNPMPSSAIDLKFEINTHIPNLEFAELDGHIQSKLMSETYEGRKPGVTNNPRLADEFWGYDSTYEFYYSVKVLKSGPAVRTKIHMDSNMRVRGVDIEFLGGPVNKEIQDRDVQAILHCAGEGS